jgi:hypothetical protein
MYIYNYKYVLVSAIWLLRRIVCVDSFLPRFMLGTTLIKLEEFSYESAENIWSCKRRDNFVCSNRTWTSYQFIQWN